VKTKRLRPSFEVLEFRRLFATFYVSPLGNDANTGLSADQPLRNIQAAINEAKELRISPAATDNQTILVAEGTYTYQDALATDSKSLGRPAVVGVIDQQLSIIGGYNSSFSQIVGESTIDGGNSQRGIVVIQSVNLTAVTLENFHITKGFGVPSTISTTLTSFGGGMMIDMGANQTNNPTNTIRNVRFTNNIVQGTASSSNSQNQGSGGEGCGGGLAVLFGNDILLQNVTFTGNQARGGNGTDRGGAALGGAMYGGTGTNYRGQSITATGNICLAGDSLASGDGQQGLITADAFGAAIAVLTNCTVTFNTFKFDGNTATAGDAGTVVSAIGGAVFGAGVYLEESNVQLTDGSISSNVGTGGAGRKGGTPAGGAIFSFQNTNRAGTFVLNRVTMQDNTLTAGASSGTAENERAGVLGGAIALQRQGVGGITATVKNCLIFRNTLAQVTGTTMALNSGGGAVWSDGAALTMEHNTIVGNIISSQMNGQAIIHYSGITNLSRNIFSDHTVGSQFTIAKVFLDSINLTGPNLFANNSANGNPSENGNVVSASSANYTDLSGGNFTPNTGSAAINAATSSTFSLDRNAKRRIGTPDLGAFEGGTPAAPASLNDKLGAYRPSDGSISLDTNGNRLFDASTDRVLFSFAAANATAIAGDWDGDGLDEIGDFKGGLWRLDSDDNGTFTAEDRTYFFGRAGDVPLIGQWATADAPGIFRTNTNGLSGQFLLDTTNSGWLTAPDSFVFGLPNDRVVVGDWNGSGTDKVGVFRSTGDSASTAVFSLDTNGNRGFEGGDAVFTFGVFTDGIVIGDWNGDGTDKVGVYRPATAFNAPFTAVFSLDNNNNKGFDPGVDEVFLYGFFTDIFVAGNWRVV
jgi:hypothetical protein